MRWFARRRQDFIADKIAADGHIRIGEIAKEFSVTRATASADMRIFKTENPAVTYNATAKRYEAREQ